LAAILADADFRAITERLLVGPATQRDLREELGLQSGSLSRQMATLEDVVLVVRERSHSPYELTRPDEIREVLVAVANLAVALDRARLDVDLERAASLRRSGMRAVDQARVGEGA
jgi:DNA-binding MarR family transcriptional regulator